MAQTTYTEIEWENESTALSAENLNHMDKGIADAHELLAGIFDAIYPVGSIYMSVDLDTPAKVIEKFGGTWVAWGSGKVPVGVDTDDTDFDTVEESGGAKTVTLTADQIPSHNHTYDKAPSTTGNTTLTTSQIPSHNHSDGYITNPLGASATGTTRVSYYISNSSPSSPVLVNSANTGNAGGGGSHNHSITSSSTNTGSKGGGQSHTNLQPYITCYMYKRTA